MSGIINKVKEVLHHDKHDSTTHTTGTTNTHTGSTGLGNSSVAGAGHGSSTTAGPHSSDIANKVDPRVDSDLDGSKRVGGTTGVHSTTGAGYGSSTTGTGYGSTNAGPHDSNVANKVDPRVDSDRDGRAAHGTTGTGFGSSTTHGTTGTTAHNSSLLNKADPRVPTSGTTGTSGYSGTHAGNSTAGHTGLQGGLSHSTNAGPHESNVANKVDPRVDSDLDGRGNRHGASTGGVFGASGSHATAGSGTAQNTAGPHNSDLLNKVDPRVDSDRDGSKTYMGNATHQ